MKLKLKVVIDILLVFFILQLYEDNYVVQAQDSTEELDFLKSAPELVVVTPYKGNTLNVTWDISNKHNLHADASFNLKYWKFGEANNQFIKQYVVDSTLPPRLWTLLMGLEPDTNYFVQVVPSNNDIEGPASEPVLGRTYRKAPIKSPTSVRTYSVDNTTLKVTWRPIQVTSVDEEPVEGYKIRLWEDDQIKTVVRDIIVPLDVKLEGFVDNLEHGKVYHVGVSAFSKAGDGKMSSPLLSFSLRPLEKE